MQSSIEEKIKTDIRSGVDRESVSSFIKRQRFDDDITEYLLGCLDDEVAIQALREVKKRDANLIIYMGYFLMAIAIFFGVYNLGFGASIFVVGFIITRRGRIKLLRTMEIDSIEELLPNHPTKFHKRRI